MVEHGARPTNPPTRMEPDPPTHRSPDRWIRTGLPAPHPAKPIPQRHRLLTRPGGVYAFVCERKGVCVWGGSVAMACHSPLQLASTMRCNVRAHSSTLCTLPRPCPVPSAATPTTVRTSPTRRWPADAAPAARPSRSGGAEQLRGLHIPTLDPKPSSALEASLSPSPHHLTATMAPSPKAPYVSVCAFAGLSVPDLKVV
jgi:hypothetical protein